MHGSQFSGKHGKHGIIMVLFFTAGNHGNHGIIMVFFLVAQKNYIHVSLMINSVSNFSKSQNVLQPRWMI